MRGSLRSIVRIVLIYSFFAILWIVLSDQLIDAIPLSPFIDENIQTIKGIGFVFVTSAMLFVLLSNESKEREVVWQEHLAEKELLLDRVQEKNNEILSAYNRTIEGWARVLEMRNREVKDHSRRVTQLTLRLAESMGVPEAELAHIRRGALLHDIGKMAIPDAIMLKNGNLSEEERAEIRRHPLYGYEMLSEIEFLSPALEILLCHHEKWNGEGYPFGLAGEQIPLFARIFSVVDVWDALLSDRAYHKGMTPDEALAYIRSEAGTHFDPKVVEAFEKMLAENDELMMPQHYVVPITALPRIER